MRKPISSWTDTLSKLGLRRAKVRTSQRPFRRGRTATLEGLEPRQMLTTDNDPLLDNEVVVADMTARGGDFTLEHVDWSGRELGAKLLTGRGKFGFQSTASDRESPNFWPGQHWSFRFDQDGVLRGIQFGDFSIEDADRAVLTVGKNEPVVIAAGQVQRGYWRAPKELTFAAGDVFRLEALVPTLDDLEAARQALNQRRDAFYESCPTGVFQHRRTASIWQVVGVSVSGRDSSTRGRFISLGHDEPRPPTPFRGEEHENCTTGEG